MNDSVTYFGTEGEGLFKMVNDKITQRFTVEDGLKSNIINSAELIGDSLFLGTRSGIDLFYNDQVVDFDFMKGESINSLIARRGYLWVGSDNGLGRYVFGTATGEFISAIESVDVSRVNHMIFDEEGSLWICTGRNGLVQVRITGISNYNEYDGMSNDNINVVAQGNDQDTYYIGADDGKVYKLYEGELSKIEVDGFDQYTGIRDVLETSNGGLWIASYKGLIYKEGKGEKFFGLKEGLPSLDIRRIIKDADDFLWLATRSGGLARMKDGKVVEVYNKENHFNTDFILSVEECPQGGVYVGTHSDGIYKIKGDSITHMNLTSDDSGIIVFNIYVDEQHGRLWVVSTAGVFLLDEGFFYKVNFESKFSSLTMYDWLEDKEGNVWVTSNQGVLRIDEKDIGNYLNNKDFSLPAIVLDEQDGMSSSECTGAVRSLMGLNNVLYIPTIAGVTAIEPHEIEGEAKIPKFYIERLVTSDSKRFKDRGAIIEPGVNRYKFEFTALSFYQSDKIRFKYKLNGFDDAFEESIGDRSVEYTNLSPGNYTFELIVSNGLGKWSEESVYFDFEVKPAYYQATWFYVVLIISISLLVYLLYRWRVEGIKRMNRKLVKVNKELDSFVYSASHDLRSPIASMLGLITLSKMDPNNGGMYLQRMEKSMKKLDDFIGEIIDFSVNQRKGVNHEEVWFKPLIEKLLDELQFLNEGKEVESVVEIDQLAPLITDERRVTIILRNLISNALKYKDQSKENCELMIQIKVDSSIADVSIKDNGVGIRQEDQEKIFEMFYRASELSTGSGLGLYIVKETVEKINGSLSMQSEYTVGTSFRVVIPSLANK